MQPANKFRGRVVANRLAVRRVPGRAQEGLLRQAVESLSEAVERSSNWLWIMRKDSSWAEMTNEG